MASPIVSFRLDPAQHRRLLARAGTRGANAFARELTLRALEEDTLAGRFVSRAERCWGIHRR